MKDWWLELAWKLGLAVAWAAVAIFIFALFSTAFGQARKCGDRGSLTEHLARTQKEYPVQNGLGPRGELFELFLSESGSWTITLVLPDGHGMACVLASGTNWLMSPYGARCAGPCG